ncbi:putative Outer membrane efflux protein [Candidatus Zixiibacteriota bacterium]|nr:putative Outer membrane efflux protein [candidate division Zixibacteria bacterium]
MIRTISKAVLLWGLAAATLPAQTVLTVEKARDLALEYNRQYLSAEKELDRAHGEIISARSGALPDISLSGRYTRNIKIPELFIAGEKIPLGLDNEFDLSLSISQPLYVGGKVGAALKIAKYYERYSHEKLREAKSGVIFSAESIFYAAVLAESNLDVVQKSFDQLSYNLDVVEKNYKQGMVSEYELLRARVEKANLEPQLVAAQSDKNLAQKKLKSFLGLPLDDEVTLAADLSDTAAMNLPPLDSLMTLALKNRPEMAEAELEKNVYDKAIRIAKGGWLYPVLSLNTTYDLSGSSNSLHWDAQSTAKSWTASLILSIPLFDGGKTIGEVRKARVDYYESVLKVQQAKDDIRLEVEQAYDNINMSKKALETQHQTIAQAEEGMRIANIRYQSGVGTQLEVLSAQTALTNARTNLARATYNYRLAKSALKKAIGGEID